MKTSKVRHLLKMFEPELRDDFQAGERNCGLSYYHSNTVRFPLGRVGDPTTPAANDRAMIEDKLGTNHGPIVHLALAPHEKHNVVSLLSEVPSGHTVVVGDGVILPKDRRFAAETLVADCAVIAVSCSKWLGMIHAGRPEIVDGVIEKFFELWPAMHTSERTTIMVGAMITAAFYELPQAPQGFEQYMATTIWGTPGFDMKTAIWDQLLKFGQVEEDDIYWSGVDPFAEHRVGHTHWGSDQWFKRLSKETGEQQYSPRDCAFVWYDPDHAILGED